MNKSHRMFCSDHALFHMAYLSIKSGVIALYIIGIAPSHGLVCLKVTIASAIRHILTCNIFCFTAIFQIAIAPNSTIFCGFSITFNTRGHQSLIALRHHNIALSIYITCRASIRHFISIDTCRQLFSRSSRFRFFTTTYNTDITIFRCRCFRNFSCIGLTYAIQCILIYNS